MSQQDVTLRLQLDASPAVKSWDETRKKIEGSPIKDPFPGLDKKLEQLTKNAKELGFAWDKASQTFKNDAGFSSTLQEMEKNIKNARAAAKDSGESFKQFANSLAKADAEVIGLKGTSAELAASIQKTAAQSNAAIGKLSAFGTTARNAGNSAGDLARNAGVLNTQLAGVGKGGAQGLIKIGDIANSTSTDLNALATSAQSTQSLVKTLGAGGSAGINKIGTDATTTAGKVSFLGTQSQATAQALQGIGANGASGLQGIASGANAAGNAFKTTSSQVNVFGQVVGTVASKAAPIGSVASTIQGVGASSQTASGAMAQLAGKMQAAAAQAGPVGAVKPKVDAVGQAAQKAQGSVKGMADQLQRTGKTANTFSTSIQTGFQQILQGIPQGIGMAIGNTLIAPLKLLANTIPASISAFRDLDEVLRLTLSIAGENSSRFNELATSVKQVGAASAATNVEVGQVAQALARAGFDLESIKQSMAGIVQGAEATGTGYAEMGDIVVSALGQFAIAASETSDVVDTLVTAANNSNQTVTDLGNALKYVGPVANTVGQSLQETGVQLALLANNGIKASTAGTSLRTILTNLQIAAGGAGEEFTELSRGSARLQTALGLIGADMTDTNGELKTGTDLIYALQDSMRSLSAGERAIVSKVLAGSEGLPALSAIVNATGDDIEKLAAKMDDRLGVAARSQEQAMAGLAGALKLFESNVSSLLGTIGALAATVFTPIVQGATALLSLFNGLPGPIQNIILALGALAAGMALVKVGAALLKVEMIAAFAGPVVAAVKSFVAALSAQGLAASLTGAATSAGALSTVIKGNLIASVATATTSINGATASLVAFNKATVLGGIKGMVTSLKGLTAQFLKTATAAKGQVVAALGSLKTAFLSGAAPTAALATSMTAVGPAAAAAATGMATTGTVAAGSATQLSLFGAAGVTAAGGATAAGTAAAAGGTAAAGGAIGFGALATSMGAFIAAALPIAAIIGAIVFSVKALQTYFSSSAKTQEKFASETDKLSKTIDNTADTSDSWYESLINTIGPLKHLIKLVPGLNEGIQAMLWVLEKLTAGFKLFFGFLEDNGKIDGLKTSQEKLNKEIEKGESVIDSNNQKLKSLDMTSAEYGQTIAENIRIQGGIITATQERINKLDAEIRKLDEAGEGNNRVAKAMKKQRDELKASLPAHQETIDKMKQEKAVAEELSGKNIETANSFALISKARNDAIGAINTTEQESQLALLEAEKNATLSAAEAKVVGTGIVVKAMRDRVAAEEEALQKMIQANKNGEISDEKLATFKEEVEARIKGSLKERTESEIAHTEAVKEAVNQRLDAYLSEQQGIASNVGAINDQLAQLGSINTSAISAFKSLADASTNYELAGIDKAEKARLSMIDKTYKDGAAKDAAKRRVEKKYEEQRLKVLQQQQTFNEAAQRATFAAKQAELALDTQQLTLQNQIAQVEAQVAIEKAKASGASAQEIAALEQVKSLTEFQGSLIQEQAGLKREVLDIENQAAQAGLAANARAKGLKTEFAGSVENVGSLVGRMEAFSTKVQSVASRAEAFKGTLGTIGTETAPEVATQIKEKLDGALANINTKPTIDVLKGLGIPPEVSAAISGDVAESLVTGAATGANQAGVKVSEVFRSGFVPKQLIKDELLAGFTEGAGLSVQAAQAEYAKLPNALPTAKIVEVLGQGLEGGAEAGKQALNALEIDPSTVAKLTAAGREGIEGGATEGIQAFNTAIESNLKVSDAVNKGITSGFSASLGAVNEWAGGVNAKFSEVMSQGAQKLQESFGNELEAIGQMLTDTIGTIDKVFPVKMISAMIEESITMPIEGTKSLIDSLALPDAFAAPAEAMSDAIDKASKAGLGQESKTVEGALKQARISGDGLKSAVSNLVNTSFKFAQNMERAASAAQQAASGVWTGGPVTPGTTYTVNELGKEMFMSSGGRLSEINVPAFGSWTPHTSGTVIPAHIANQIRDGKAAAKAEGAMTGLSGGTRAKIQLQAGASSSDSLQRALVRELRRMHDGGQTPVSNNITIQSAAPVNDASRMLAEMNRIRAYRR